MQECTEPPSDVGISSVSRTEVLESLSAPLERILQARGELALIATQELVRVVYHGGAVLHRRVAALVVKQRAAEPRYQRVYGQRPVASVELVPGLDARHDFETRVDVPESLDRVHGCFFF